MLDLKSGVDFERYFSKNGTFDAVEWDKLDITISDEQGKPLFVQKSVEFPKFWSQRARQIVASRYFYGENGKPERENSMRQVIGRVAETFANWGIKKGYFSSQESADIFRDEIECITMNQLMAFNSPVWFNVGVVKYFDKNRKTSQKDAYIVSDSGEIIRLPFGSEYEYPQTSACFIQSVDDTMESIMQLAVNEAMLFKYGSGTGTDLSTLRSSKEKLAGGGKPSGPLAYLQFYDKVAGIVKSGGKTRRAAKMNSIRIDHPDVMDFIESKAKEQKKLEVLMDLGGWDYKEAETTVAFQNANLSVRLTDRFMHALENDEDWQTIPVHNKELLNEMPKYPAREILKKIAEGTWGCGDPGVQYHDTVNKWHTCPNSAPINASNPCVTGDTKVLTREGRWKRIDSILNQNQVILTNTGVINENEITGSFETGVKPVYRLTTKSGYELKLTADHKVFTINRGFVQSCELTKDDFILLPEGEVAEIKEISNKEFYQILGLYLGDGGSGEVNSNRGIPLCIGKNEQSILEKISEYVSLNYERQAHKTSPACVQIINNSSKFTITNTRLMDEISEFVDLNLASHQKRISDKIFSLSLSEQKYILQGLFTSDGTVANYGEKSQYISLDSTSLGLLKDTQILLLGFGIKSKVYPNRRAGKEKALLPDGTGGVKEYPVKEMHSLRISRSGRIKFEKLIGFMPESYKSKKLAAMSSSVETYKDLPIDSVDSFNYAGEERVYDLTEPMTHTFVANGITIHNCSEYMFVNDSSCNLASLNLMRFMKGDDFDLESFLRTVHITAIAQDLEFDNSSFPTKKIAENSHKFRPLGMGYANLGALLMYLGLPYDSDEGRAVAATLTALLTGKAYLTSTEMAEKIGTFAEFEKNKYPMLNVMRMHRDSLALINREKLPAVFQGVLDEAENIWDRVIERGEKFGFRNAQASVLAPTGTIGFMMDCDTTGIEPEAWLVKHKKLAEGGTIKIVNNTVEAALKRLGYLPDKIRSILEFIQANDTIEGSEIKDEHLSVFDCAYRPANGKRCISYLGHLKMMAAVQPFLSGAISKTVGLPNETVVEEIEKIYVDAWKMGLKAVALYRDGSKRWQPLSVKKKEEKKEEEVVARKPVRRKLPTTAPSIRHKFSVAGHEGYIHVGMYEDGTPGEVFVSMSKEGSTIGGLMDALATSLSLNLQYGVALESLVKKFRHQNFEPRGLVLEGHQDIHTATSIVDYVFNYLSKTFLGKDAAEVNGNGDHHGGAEEQVTLKQIEKQIAVPDVNKKTAKEDEEAPGGFCITCGTQMIKKGHCVEKCPKCGWVNPRGCGE
jgi:ribonucleoside-diphosphate reductase alpha chain